MNNSQNAYDKKKRIFDIFGSLILIVATAPVQLIVACLVAYKLGRPVIFRQPRPGKNAKVFTLLKFRTMRPVDESRGWVTDEQRLVPFGRLLRSTSLDELPSLWNVLRGEMSLVGPRPLRVHYLSRYSLRQARRHEVRPGVTGLAQVSGRNRVDWDSKLELDVTYVENRSGKLDIQILIKTLTAVFKRSGISAEGEATVSEFMGDTSASSKGDKK